MDKDDGLHSSDLIAMTNAALHSLVPAFDSLPPYFQKWIKEGLMIEMHKAYQNSRYAREAMRDDN